MPTRAVTLPRARRWLARLGRIFATSFLAGCTAALSCSFPSYEFVRAAPDDRSDACADAECAEPGCPAGRGDCNDEPGDGCETVLDSLDHCGSCRLACTNAHGSTTCSVTATAAADGRLAVCEPWCAVGFADCDLNPSNGCEASINNDPLNCGECGIACPSAGGTAVCQARRCGISSCNDGFGDCKNIGNCDFNLNTDPENCGRCGHACSSKNGTASCNGGVCEIACESGFGDCNRNQTGGPPDDGCETKLNVPDDSGSVPNCGACGAACTRRAFTTIDVQQCELGICSRRCFDGQDDCDNNRNDPGCRGSNCGCETNLASNPSHCGECGNICSGGSCIASTCR